MITCRAVTKHFATMDQQQRWSADAIDIAAGERVLVTGPSGCGKTTFLNLLAGLLRPDSGAITLAGERLDTMEMSELDVFRGQHIGLIFQSFQLLNTLTVLDNILLGAHYGRKWSFAEAKQRARHLLEDVGLTRHANAYPRRLSRGEQQRVAIARALINNPPVLLADEPTASLDPRNTDAVLDMLFHLCDTQGATLVMVSHDVGSASRFTRMLDASPWMAPEPQQEVAHV